MIGPGEVLVIPSNVPHKAEALADTLDVDVFCPPRQDWLDKTDDYLRRKCIGGRLASRRSARVGSRAMANR